MSMIFGVGITVWMTILITLISIGGFFMLRKFLKSMPKEDGKSELDWQDYYIEKSLPLWTEEGRELLEELVSPVPAMFRDVAKRSIAAKIGKLALEERVELITIDVIIRGYIMATPKRDHKMLKSHLENRGIDYTPYQHLFSS
ncbi:DUF2621 family protein [Rubeoparvulum massiliense]|uniref:DUF2621 family protein n=1 Tax=Rubeoparvulum massiliense TaxID=1631346 RepID=UPI00065E6BDF|nr:DUF2621 family protein [Rubeoparvulum massiliense]